MARPPAARGDTSDPPPAPPPPRPDTQANTTTANYGWIKPEVGADTSAWGLHLNGDLDGIDGVVFAAATKANAAMPTAGGTFTGPVTLSAANPQLTLSSPPGGGRAFFFATSGTPRWHITADPVAESGGNAGSNFQIGRWTDAGVVIDAPFSIVRSTGLVSIADGLTVGGVATINGPLQTLAANASGAGLNVPHGVAPSAPVNGALWTTAAGAYVQINGATVPFAVPGGGVTSFQGRTGAVGLVASDVDNALGYFPANKAGDVFGGPIIIDTPANAGQPFAMSAGGQPRWHLGRSTNEAGGNTGSDFYIARWSDGGAFLDYSMQITRSSGQVSFPSAVGVGFSGPVALAGGASVAPLATPLVNEVGYMGAPVNLQNGGNYQAQLSDRGKNVLFNANGVIGFASSSGFPQGTIIQVSAWPGTTVTIATNGPGDQLMWIPSGTVGVRTLHGPGIAIVQWIGYNLWWVKGDIS